MKQLFTILVLTVFAVVNTQAQGIVFFFNSNSTKVSTNSVYSGSATGLINTVGNYRFALFYSKTATSVNGQTAAIAGSTNSNYAFNDNNWTLAAYGTNTFTTGRFTSTTADSSSATAVSGLAGGTAAQFVVIGWSASIGPDIAAVKSWFNNAGPPGWIGQSVVSGPITPGVDGLTVPAALFGTAAPYMPGFTLGLGGDLMYYSPTTIWTQPTNQTVSIDGTTTFSVTATSDYHFPLVAQWRLNGTNITSGGNYIVTSTNQNIPYYYNASTFALTVTNAQLTNAGNYSVYVYNDIYSAISSNAFLTVQSSGAGTPPTITAQPTNMTVLAGTNATFAVTVTGTAPLSYQWSLNGTNLMNATNATLALVNVQVTNAGNYAVVVTNLYGAITSSNGVLTVQSGIPPGILTQPASLSAPAGSNATFTVTASGTAPLNYQWSFNGTNLANATNASLTLVGVQPASGGNYAVTIANAYGTTNSAAAVLTVQTFPPVILVQPVANSSGQTGGTVFLTVTASGTTPLSYQWTFNGTNLVNQTNTFLWLDLPTTNYAGIYAVTVSNPYGTTNSANAVLSVVADTNGAQVYFNNNNGTKISTNSTYGGVATGLISPAVGYRFALFYSTTATNVNGQTVAIAGGASSDYAFNDSTWTLASYGTNTLTAGRFASTTGDSSSVTAIPGLAGGTVAQFVVIGWSANIGTNITDVQNWFNTVGSSGWIGQSVVSGPVTTGVAGLTVPASLFGTGAGYIPGFTLGLASVGGAPIVPYILAGGQPTNQTAYVGSTISFAASYSAYPAPTIQWQFNGTNIIGGTNAVYTLGASFASAGYYSVTISNSAGSVTSSNVLLTVLPTPGYVFFQNSAASATKIFTNTSVSGPITGLTTPAGGYCYALFVSASATTVNGLSYAIQGATNSGYAFNDPAWTFVAYGTNFISAGRLRSANTDIYGQTAVSVVSGGQYARFAVMGWSVNIGTNIAAVQTWFNGGNPLSDGWIGQSDVSGPILLGDGGLIATPTLFGASSPNLKGFTLGLASPVFARAYSLPYVPPPVLTTTKVGNFLKLSWSSFYSSYGVQSSASFMGPWDDVAGTPTTDGTNLTQTIPVNGQQPYFRLIVK